jgi:hypothetical protein
MSENQLSLQEQAQILIREGFLQEKDRERVERIRARWHLRETVPQINARGLRERPSE